MIKKLFSLFVALSLAMILFGCQISTNLPYTIDEIESAIVIGYGDGDQADYVTQNIELPTTSPLDDQATITWYSIFPSVISEDGIVTRSDSDRAVTLTYTINYGSDIKIGNLYLTVIGLNQTSVYKITFDSQGGSAVDQIIANEGDSITQPDDPTRDGYEFVGWYTSTSYLHAFTFDIMPSGDVTLYAKWNYIDTNVYTITFDSNGGTSVSAISDNGGVRISEPTAPTKDGYDFAGWYADSALTESYTFSFMPYESIILYAKWTEQGSYTGYYEGAAGLYGTALKTFLHDLINTGFSGVTYGDSRYILDDTDADPAISGNVILLYLGTSVSGTWDGGVTWNREHVWPQSLLGVSAVNEVVNEASDLQNLKPADPSTNSSRGNKYYADVTNSYSYAPRDSVKGDIARILFYMATMYANFTLVDLSGTEEPAVYTMGDLSTLLAWNTLDPVDSFEMARNDYIYSEQGNRNPYIDHPELVDKIWG